jgi:AcrR family transcriptional regulator
MPSVTRSARQGGRDSRKASEEALLRATERLLGAGHRFTELSVEQLATAAGTSRSTFYVYFRDKGDLIGRLTMRVADELVGAFDRWRSVAAEASIEDLREATVSMLGVYQQHQVVLAALVETATYDPEAAAVFNRTMAEFSLKTGSAIDVVREAGRARPDLPEGLAEVLTLMVERSCYLLARGADEERRARLADVVTHVFWNAIYAPSEATFGEEIP